MTRLHCSALFGPQTLYRTKRSEKRAEKISPKIFKRPRLFYLSMKVTKIWHSGRRPQLPRNAKDF